MEARSPVNSGAFDVDARSAVSSGFGHQLGRFRRGGSIGAGPSAQASAVRSGAFDMEARSAISSGAFDVEACSAVSSGAFDVEARSAVSSGVPKIHVLS